MPFACLSSMLINRASVGRYAELITGRWAAGVPLDLYLRGLVRRGELRAFVTVPFATSISADSAASDIRGSLSRSRRVCDVYRRAFFEAADRRALLAEVTELTRGRRVSVLEDVYLATQAFALSEDWEPF